MNPYNNNNNTHQPYPFSAPPSFQSSTGSSYPSYPPSGYSTSSNSSTYTTNPQGLQVPTYTPTPGAVSQPINVSCPVPSKDVSAVAGGRSVFVNLCFLPCICRKQKEAFLADDCALRLPLIQVTPAIPDTC